MERSMGRSIEPAAQREHLAARPLLLARPFIGVDRVVDVVAERPQLERPFGFSRAAHVLANASHSKREQDVGDQLRTRTRAYPTGARACRRMRTRAHAR